MLKGLHMRMKDFRIPWTWYIQSMVAREYFTGTFGQTATLLQYCQHALILGIERLCVRYSKRSQFNDMHNNSTDACSCSWLAYEHCILMGWTNYMLRELIQPDCIISLPFNIWYDIIGFTNKFFVLIMWYNKLFRPQDIQKVHLPSLIVKTNLVFINQEVFYFYTQFMVL